MLDKSTGILVLGVTFVLMGFALSYYRRKSGAAQAELAEERAHREADGLKAALEKLKKDAEEATNAYETMRDNYHSKSTPDDNRKG